MTRGSNRAPALALMVFCFSLPATSFGVDVSRDEVRQFIDHMVRVHHFHRDDLNTLLSGAQPQPRILEAIQRPAERTLAWWEYRQRFLTNERIDNGVQLWRQHAETLSRIAAQSGVPAEYLIAITGVETLYGRQKGRYRVLDALSTLGFDYPPRSEFFRKELEQFLMMCREEKMDPQGPLGSYAGAMGVPQFMPSSFRRYAVDGTGDGHRDLWEPGADVFASVANYLRENGWRAGEPVLVDARNDGSPDDPAGAKLALSETVASLRQRGYQFETPLPDTSQAMLVPAQLQEAMSWRIGFQNFYTITRYNRSPLYAMAVNDLAQEIAARYKPLPATSDGPLQPAVGGS